MIEQAAPSFAQHGLRWAEPVLEYDIEEAYANPQAALRGQALRESFDNSDEEVPITDGPLPAWKITQELIAWHAAHGCNRDDPTWT